MKILFRKACLKDLKEVMQLIKSAIDTMEKNNIYHWNEFYPIEEDFIEDMSVGVYLPELEQTTRPCKVEFIGKYTFRIILTQGLNRQIRRMCKELGYQVKQLRRVRIANIELGKLRPREYRRLTGQELEMLYSKVRNQE